MSNMADKELSPEEKKQNAQIMSSVKAWLALKDIKQVDLVEHLNISTGTASKWLNGNISPKISQLQQIADMLQINLITLLTYPAKNHFEKRFHEVKEIAKNLDDSAYQSWVSIGKQLTK